MLWDKGVVVPGPGRFKDLEASPFSASAEGRSSPVIKSLCILHRQRCKIHQKKEERKDNKARVPSHPWLGTASPKYESGVKYASNSA